MQSGVEKKYGGLDWFRIIAAFLVIANHTSPLLSYNALADFALTRIVSRVMVPFFFMCTGYFFLQKIGTDKSKNFVMLKKFLTKVGILYGLSILLYLPINVYAGYFTPHYSASTLVKDLLFNGTLYHLWYFPGIMLGVCICYYLYTRLSPGRAFLIALLLFGIGLLGDSYYAVVQIHPVTESLYQALFFVFDSTRNGVFYAPVFVMLGGLIAAQGQLEKEKSMLYLAGFILCFAMMVLEGLLVEVFQLSLNNRMYLMSVPSLYFLFQLLLGIRSRSNRYLRNMGMVVFVIHPMCIVIVRAVGRGTGLTPLIVNNSLVHFLTVTVLSFVIAAIGMGLVNKGKERKERTPDDTGRAWAEIDVAHLQHNVREIRRVLPGGCEIIAVVKAQAYGHGGWQVARYLSKLGVGHFAVATLEEGIELRRKGIKGHILILGYTHECFIGKIGRYKLTQTVVNAEHAKKLNDAKVNISVHIKIDTGMGRLGEPHQNIEAIASMYQYTYLHVRGTFTHLNVADSLEQSDVVYTCYQISLFRKVIEQLRAKGIDPQKLHVQSSYGVLNYPELEFDYARIGIALYGVLSRQGDNVNTSIELRPVLSLRARVVQVKRVEKGASVGYGQAYTAERDGNIAIVSIGYADGVPREVSQTGACCLIKGRRAPVIGSICMDQLIVDVAEIDHVMQGDVATLIGTDQREVISAEQVAGQCHSITNELLSRVGERVNKRYRSESYPT